MLEKGIHDAKSVATNIGGHGTLQKYRGTGTRYFAKISTRYLYRYFQIKSTAAVPRYFFKN